MENKYLEQSYVIIYGCFNLVGDQKNRLVFSWWPTSGRGQETGVELSFQYLLGLGLWLEVKFSIF